MKLHTLTMRDIGPFTGEQTIHFDALPSLFLISGPTGSGKTSILDAITFALFGNTSGGSDSSDSRIRSHFANPLAPSYVDLIFEVESGIYRAYRSPKWLKEGNKTESNASGFLMKLSSLDDEEGEPITEHVRDMTAHCTRLLGMNHAQFCQAVLLPQGKFDAFLMMNSKERAAGLEKIFRTGIYSRFTAELRTRANTARQEQQGRAGKITTLADRITNTFTEDPTSDDAGTPEPLRAFEASPQGKNLDVLTAWINDVYQAHLDTLADLHSRAHAAQQASEKATQRLAEAEENARLITELDQLSARLQTLSDEEAAMELQRARLEAAREAAPLLEDVMHLEAQHRSLRDAEQALGTLEKATGCSSRTPRELRSFARATESRYSAAREELNAIAHYRETHSKLAAAMAHATTSRNKVADAKIAANDARIALSECREKLNKERDYLDLYNDARSDVERLDALIDVFLRTSAEEEQATEAKRHAEEAYGKAEERLADYHARERSYAAWQLATTLTDGEPCPTCGSRQHPMPASAPAELNTDEGEALEAALAACANAREEARLHAQRAADARIALEAEGNLELWREERAAQQGLVEAHVNAPQAFATLEAEAAQLEAKIPELEERHHTLEIAHARAQSEVEILENALTAAQETLAGTSSVNAGGAAGAVEDFAEREEALQAEVTRLAQVREALPEHEEALEEFVRYLALTQQGEENVTRNLARSRFESVDEVREAAMEASEAARLESEILAFFTELHSVRERRADPRFACVDRDVDVRVVAREAEAARAAEKAVRDRVSREEERGRIAGDVLKEYHAACEAFSAGGEDAGALAFLANIASGGEGSLTNIPLSSYVLRERFAQLLEGANEHLARISHERYQLVHVDDRVGNERQVGLGLLAVDEFAGGTRREVNSLSGGERFYFSLCLALALSDLIQQENGGIQIGTLLIDEGFGALSPEHLDEVVEVIHSLAAHGQRIGVISHVEGLKRMIPARISLQHSAGRSRLEVVAEAE